MRIPAFVRLTFRNILVNMDPGTMLFLLGMPALYLVVMGAMFQGFVPNVSVGNVSINYETFLTPGIIGMQTLTAGNIGAGMLWADRRWGMFEQILVGPFKRVDYLLSIMLLSVTFTLAGGAIMAVIAVAMSVTFAYTALNLAMMVIILSVGAMFFSSVFLIMSLTFKTMNAYNTATIFLFFFQDFASTAFYPVTSKTPVALKYMVYVNPLTYIVDAARYVITANDPLHAVLYTGVVTALMLVFFSIAIYMYSHMKGTTA